MPPKMYAVIKFKQLPTNEIFDYQCVPSSWIRCCNDNRQITVAYPSPVTESTERHIRSGRDPLQKWPLFPAIFVTEIDSYTAWAHILLLIRENYTCDVEDVITMLNQSDQHEHGGNIYLEDFKPEIIPDKRNSELTTSTTRQFQEEKKEPSRDMIDFNERKKQELNNERFERESQRPSTSSGQRKSSLDRCIPNNKLNESIVKKIINFIPDFKPEIIPDKRNSELTTSTTRQFQEEKKEPSRDMIDFNERKKQELNNERFERESQRPPTSSGQRKSSLDRSIPNNKLNESIVKKMIKFIPDFKPEIIPVRRNSELTTSTTRQFQEEKKEPSRDMIDFNERKKQELNNERFERESQRPPTSSGQRKSSLDRCIPNNKLNESIVKIRELKQISVNSDLHREEELHRRKENTKVNESIGESNRTKYTSIAFHSNREEESHQRNENRNLNESIGGSSCTKHTSGASDSNRCDELHRDENRKLNGSIGNTSGRKRTSETSFSNQEDELQQKYSKAMKSSSSKALATRTLPQIDRKVLNKFKESCEQITLFLEELLTKNEEGCI